jgi:trimeric autotransporter adhesin
VRVNKRLQKGISLGANYQYGHAIDDASSVNGSGGSVVQDWQNPARRRATRFSTSPPGERHLSFRAALRPDKYWVTSGRRLAHS